MSYRNETSRIKQDPNGWFSLSNLLFVAKIIFVLVLMLLSTSVCTNEKQHAQKKRKLLLSKSIKEVVAEFHNHISDIWNDIASAINKVITRTLKVPSIILLYLNESEIMNCLPRK